MLGKRKPLGGARAADSEAHGGLLGHCKEAAEQQGLKDTGVNKKTGLGEVFAITSPYLKSKPMAPPPVSI